MIGEKTVADNTYKDPYYFIYPHGNPESIALQKRIMARHETANDRLKNFKVLSTKFRHKLEKHSLCFHAVVNITQVMLCNGEPLFGLNV